MANSLLPPLSLYVHIPWCVRKCPYCDFNSHEAGDAINEQRYIDALLSDLDQERALTGQRELKSIFLGGGTPSLFSPESMSHILTGISDRMQLANNIEITMEANPGTFEQEKFSAFRSVGINRLSIGIQSFNEAHLKKLGRIHDSKQAHTAISTAMKAGFDNINLDLMFGLPEQTIEQAVNDVQTACDYNVQHISHYQLTIEPNTLFHKHPPVLPETEQMWEMQSACHEKLSEHSYHQYEVSAFSKADKQSQHNLNYWLFGDYIGIGAGAHGKLTTGVLTLDGKITRRWKHRQPENYMSHAKNNPLSGQSDIAPNELVFEFLLNALRLKDGFTYDVFEQTTGLKQKSLIDACEAVDPELLIIDESGVRTSEKGYLFLNDVLQQFL